MAMTLAEQAKLGTHPLRRLLLTALLPERHTWRDQARVNGRFAGVTKESCTLGVCLVHMDFVYRRHDTLPDVTFRDKYVGTWVE